MDDKHYRARITKRADFAPDLWMIRVDPGADFPFIPGQYATLGVEKDARRLERPYSIASSPYEKELEFFFELVPEGQTTPPLYDLQPGDEVLLRKSAKGRFTLDTTQPGRTHHLMLSTVTGIAPFVSFARTLFKDWKEGRFAGDHELFLLSGASRSWEFGYREELERIAAEVPWFKYVATISRPWEDASWKGQTGRVDDLVRMYVDEWNLHPGNTTGYLCGHPRMCENGQGILARAGWGKGSTFEEVYFIPGKEAGVG